MHEDPVTKSKRVTNSSGSIVSTIELDPWGADTNRSSTAAFQPHKYTSYERDGNASDEAMFRRYNRYHSRFDQPDPYHGSYDQTNPQSFNRYAYAQNDPVNFADPDGLCSFSVALDNQSNITAGQLDAMKTRISAIFGAAGQQISFLPGMTQGADYNLTIISAAPSSVSPRAVGSTDLLGGAGSAVNNVGRVWVDRLTNSATDTAAGRILLPVSPNFLGYGLGMAAAHEIGHYLLQQNFDSWAISGIMHAGFTGVEWFGAVRTFNAAQIMKLNSLCAPVTTDRTVPNNSPIIRGGGGGGGFGGGYIGGGGYPSWMYSMWAFVAAINSIPVGGGYGEVVGYYIAPPKKTN